MNGSTSSLKVTVNGKKYLITGIQKETSCKGLLCAIAKVTSKEDFQLRSNPYGSGETTNENLLERFKGDRELAGDLKSLNIFNSLSGDAKIIAKETVTVHKEIIIDDSTTHQQVQTTNSKHSHKRNKKLKSNKESSSSQSKNSNSSTTVITKEDKSERKAKQKHLLKKLHREKEKQATFSTTSTNHHQQQLVETTTTTTKTTSKHSSKKQHSRSSKKHRSVDDSDIESYKRDSLLRSSKTKKRTYYDDSDVDVYKTLERIVIDQTKKLHRIQTHTKEVKKSAWMKELTRNSQVYFIDDHVMDTNGHIMKEGGPLDHINTESCLFEKDDGNDSGLPSPEYDSSESQENQPINIKDKQHPRDLLHNNNNGDGVHNGGNKLLFQLKSQITKDHTADQMNQQEQTKEIQNPITNKNNDDEEIVTTTSTSINSKNITTSCISSNKNQALDEDTTTLKDERVEDKNNNNINELSINATTQHQLAHQNKPFDRESVVKSDNSNATNDQYSATTTVTRTAIKDHSICNHNNTSIVSEKKEEIINTSTSLTSNEIAALKQKIYSNNNSNKTNYQRVHDHETVQEIPDTSETDDTGSSELNSVCLLTPTSYELQITSSDSNSHKNQSHAILTVLDKNENLLSTETIPGEQQPSDIDKKEQENDEDLTTMKLDKNRNVLSESKCDLQVSKMVAFNEALFKGSVSSANIIHSTVNFPKKQDKKKLKKSDISDPVLLSPSSFKKHQSLKKVQSVLGKQAADVLKRDILKSLPQMNKNGGDVVQKDDSKNEQKEKEKYYNKKLKEIRRSKKEKKSNKNSSSTANDNTEYLPKSQFSKTDSKIIADIPQVVDEVDAADGDIIKSSSVTDNNNTDDDVIAQENSPLKTTANVIDEIDKGIIEAVTNDLTTNVDEEEKIDSNHRTITKTAVAPAEEEAENMYEKTCQQNLTADEIFNEILEYERNIKSELDQIIQADEEENTNEQQKNSGDKKNTSIKIKHDLILSSSATTKTTKSATRKLQQQKINTKSSISPQVDYENKKQANDNKLVNGLSSRLSNQKNKKSKPTQQSSQRDQTHKSQEDQTDTASGTDASNDDSKTKMSLLNEYERERQSLDELSEKLSDYNYILTKLTEELEILNLEQDQSKSIKDLEYEEYRIQKEIDNVKSLLRSSADITTHQRKEMSENLEMLDNIDLEIRTRKANYENLRNGTWRTNSQSAPRSLIKNAKVKRRNAHLGITGTNSTEQNRNGKSSSFV